MKRLYVALFTVIFLPLIAVGSLYFVNKSLQPQTLDSVNGSETVRTSYLDDSIFYEYTGELKAYPGVLLDYDECLSSSNYVMIDSLESIKAKDFLVDNNYLATVKFDLNLPTNTSYAVWFPSEFCDYRIYLNGRLIKESETYDSKLPMYANGFYVKLSGSVTGEYTLVCDFKSPKSYINNASSAILIGAFSKVAPAFNALENVSIIIITYIIFNIIFMAIQNIAFRKDRRLLSFLVLSFATLLIISVSDGKSILTVFPSLPYQVGCFLEAISSPLFLLALIDFTNNLFPDFLPKRLVLVFAVLLLVPFANALCLGQFPILAYAATFINVVPYAICLYVFALAFENHRKHALSYGLGVLFVESSVLLYFATSSMAIQSHYAYGGGYIVFGITMVSIIAGEYATQTRAEAFYTEELSKQLEAMQASENAFLNAQMKPHFLYNTLNTIADCCVTDSEKAKSLINSLSEYLKLILSLDNMDKTVPLRRELELAEAYTAIEKERFPSINFYTDFPVRLPSIMMPPLTIQPLIENAIKHGVRKSDKPGVVTLRIIEEPDCVEFFVSDNGVGMNQDEINNLFKVPKENKSIGIYNIDKRLKNIYKKGLKVESTQGLGTCVSFKVMKYV